MEKYIKMLKELAHTVKDHVARAVNPIKEKLAEVEDKVAQIEAKELPFNDIAVKAASLIEKPENGKDADPELIKQTVKEEVLNCFDKIELPKDGKSIEPEDVRGLIIDELSKIELPKGENGDAGEKGEKGDNGQDGENGKSAFEIAKEKGFSGTELEWLSSFKGENGKDGRDGRDGKDGRDGENGKDALQIEILPLIDESKTYPRGAYASHNGGLWHAVKNTQGLDGWECLIEGIKDISINFNGERDVSVAITKSSNQVITKSFNMPAMIYRGVYSAEKEYNIGDTVTWGGSLWHCQEATKEKPSESKSWVLCAKKGRDGKDGEKGDRGEKGDKGKDGRDLTQLGGDGAKW